MRQITCNYIIVYNRYTYDSFKSFRSTSVVNYDLSKLYVNDNDNNIITYKEILAQISRKVSGMVKNYDKFLYYEYIIYNIVTTVVKCVFAYLNQLIIFWTAHEIIYIQLYK